MNNKEYWDKLKNHTPCSQPIYINCIRYTYEKLLQNKYSKRDR
jgi:hypothetical protein